jgi:hypothetical protein
MNALVPKSATRAVAAAPGAVIVPAVIATPATMPQNDS